MHDHVGPRTGANRGGGGVVTGVGAKTTTATLRGVTMRTWMHSGWVPCQTVCLDRPLLPARGLHVAPRGPRGDRRVSNAPPQRPFTGAHVATESPGKSTRIKAFGNFRIS